MKHGYQFYADIFDKARHAAWHHKEVWLIAALAGLANTGTILDSIYRLFYDQHPETAVSFTSFGRFLKETPAAQRTILWIMAMPASELLFVIFLSCIVVAAVGVAVFGAQQLTIVTAARAGASEEPLPPRQLINTLSHVHFLRLAVLNSLGAVGMLLIFGACGLFVETFTSGNLTTDFITAIAAYAVSLPLTFAVSLFTILSVIESVRKNDGIVAAMTDALKAMRHHWLMGLEISALLFLINLALSAIVFIFIFGITFFLSIVAATAATGGHLFLAAILSVFGASIATASLICYGGFITLFNYTTWVQFLQSVEKKSILPIIGNMVKSVISYVPRPSLD